MPTVLIVDDEASVRKMLGAFLSRVGYDLVTANDGDDGLTAFWKHRPDLVILDAMMPRMNGFKVCKILKQHPESMSVPVVILTSRGLDRDKTMALSLGADLYLVKPVDLSALALHLESLLSRPPEDRDG